MDIDLKISNAESNIEEFRRMLDVMPEDTFVGRLCIKAYLKREERRLKNLLVEKQNLSQKQ